MDLIPESINNIVQDIGQAVFPAISDDAAKYLIETGSLDDFAEEKGTGRRTAADVEKIGGYVGQCLSPTTSQLRDESKVSEGNHVSKAFWLNSLNGSEAEFDRCLHSSRYREPLSARASDVLTLPYITAASEWGGYTLLSVRLYLVIQCFSLPMMRVCH